MSTHASAHPGPDRHRRSGARRADGRGPARRRRARACARPAQRPRAAGTADRRGLVPRDGRAGDARAGRRRTRSCDAGPRADAGRRRRRRHGARSTAGRSWSSRRTSRCTAAASASSAAPRPSARCRSRSRRGMPLVHDARRRRPSHPGRPGFAPLRPCQRHVPQFRARLGLDPDGGADAGRGLCRADQLCRAWPISSSWCAASRRWAWPAPPW